MPATAPVTLHLGEVLWDVLPDGKTLGGATTNVSWHAAQLGAEAHLVSAVGDDPLGLEVLARLRGMKMDVSNIVTMPGIPTSTVEARLDERGNASYVIHENVAWDHLAVTPAMLELAAGADAVNYGSLAQRSPAGLEATHAILAASRPEAVRIFDINLREPFIYPEVVDGGMRRATVVKMNEDELPQVAGMFGWTTRPEDAIVQLLAAYPSLLHVIVTRGAKGMWWHDRHALHAGEPGQCAEVMDTIGAGDSVTAASMMGLLKGWAVDDIMASATAIASYVCGCRGGTPELPLGLKARFLAG